jgi:hypothetical protein
VESSKFTVEVHHGGYFAKSGQSVRYLDEKSTIWFDNVDRNIFKRDTLDSMIDQLGYENRKCVFWCPPRKDFYQNSVYFFSKFYQYSVQNLSKFSLV